MAQRRMFSPKIIDTDNFLDMPVSARELYFQFGIRADDDGFVSNPKRIMKMIGAGDDDLKVLIAKNYIIPFSSGVVVITSWHINNLVRKDWYRETDCIDEKKSLALDRGKYKLVNETTTSSLTQVRLGKVSIGKVSIGKVSLNKLNKEGGELTPSKEMNLFLEDNGNYFNELLQSIVEKTDILEDSARKELISFISYWTERNKSGTKQRWELEKTFELKRRLNTWFRNAGKFNSTKGKGKTILI